MTPPDIVILVAPRFAEKAVVYCLSTLRQQGFIVSLVSVTPGQVQSRQGMNLCPDASLSDMEALLVTAPADKCQLVLLAGGADCAATILADPRAHDLVQHILQRGGWLAAMAETYELVQATGLLHADWLDRFLRQGSGVEMAVFVQQIICQLG
ncbi:MAG: DJ-1/PfpI family protein [Ardenticatenaceae bacterium]|nr:DJ-1/PfpI family protein [Ardenticatenaceae bacterium]